ncbi:2-hydroxyacid dehydrogenase [Roseitranquillus sediminis]|uniref:2-hydroxyacid dehydrogenase n=1 Tax=Roseitranquillus sediminis TaxID=2809051 RepID=UPI001D0CD6E9|nr:glyoxylate/hydroxypyruvate reductase A [Roseitranquillus sediminis]MBM9594519.1 glyoxylate/hydroxypyruvate reductase A [Roseitranquillus sediminis]
MTTVLFAAKPARWREYERPLREALAEAGVDVKLTTEAPPDQVDYIIYAPNSGIDDFRPFIRLKAVLNLWAGVEDIAPNPTLTVPLARMVDRGLTQGMVEYVTGHVLRHHLGMDPHVRGLGGDWPHDVPPLAPERKVGVLGLGALGAACASALAALGFDVAGWSRRPHTLDGVTCHHGEAGMQDVLARSEIVVLLLPLTAATENLLIAQTISRMRRGAVVINPGRGALIDDDALLAALDDGQLGHATLDTFREEPLPGDHPFWSHPKVTVTPHIASATRPSTASRVIAENVRRGEAGEPLLHLVDRDAGY